MPSTSKKQHNFMNAVAHNPAFAKKAGVPQSVGQDFSKADKGKTFKSGGNVAKSSTSDKSSSYKAGKFDTKKTAVLAKDTKGFTRKADGIAQRGKTKAKEVTMNGSK